MSDDGVGLTSCGKSLEPAANPGPDATEVLDRSYVAHPLWPVAVPSKKTGQPSQRQRGAPHPMHQEQPHQSSRGRARMVSSRSSSARAFASAAWAFTSSPASWGSFWLSWAD